MSAPDSESSNSPRLRLLGLVCVIVGIYFVFRQTELAGTPLRGIGFILLGCWALLAHKRWRRVSLVGWAGVVCLVTGYGIRYADALRHLAAWLF